MWCVENIGLKWESTFLEDFIPCSLFFDLKLIRFYPICLKKSVVSCRTACSDLNIVALSKFKCYSFVHLPMSFKMSSHNSHFYFCSAKTSVTLCSFIAIISIITPLMMMMMMMMNSLCGMVDWQKGFSLIYNWDHCQRLSLSRISNMLWAGFKSAQNLSSALVEWSCAVVITITPLHIIISIITALNITTIFIIGTNHCIKFLALVGLFS